MLNTRLSYFVSHPSCFVHRLSSLDSHPLFFVLLLLPLVSYPSSLILVPQPSSLVLFDHNIAVWLTFRKKTIFVKKQKTTFALQSIGQIDNDLSFVDLGRKGASCVQYYKRTIFDKNPKSFITDLMEQSGKPILGYFPFKDGPFCALTADVFSILFSVLNEVFCKFAVLLLR